MGPLVLTTLARYGVITANMTRSLGNTAAKPQVARETEYYLAHIRDVKSIDDFLANGRLFAYAMKAWGLEDMTYAKAFMRKVLSEGVDKTDSFANSLSDQRYRQFAAAFNFARYGSATTVFDRTQKGTADKYVRQTLEEDVGQQSEGVRLALYFDRNAADIKSPYSILADRALLKVVQTALGLPASMSLLSIDKQAAMISKRLAVEDLKDPDKLKAFLTKFAVRWEIDNSTASSSTPTLLSSQPIEAGLGVDVLTSLQNLKLGGR